MKKSLILFLMLVGLLLCGCTPKDTGTVIQFASWGSKSEVDILKPMLADFEAENPDIKVDFMHIPQNYFQKIHLLFASHNAPDVVFVNNLYLPVYANAGVLEPLQIDETEYFPQALNALSRHGVLYAVPRDVSNLAVYYNKDIFDKYNVPYPDEDWTFADFLQTAQKLTRDGIFGISFEEDALFYLPYLMSEGGGILSDDLAHEIIDSPESQKGLNFYADLRKKYHVAPLKSESASATMAQMFLQGKLAMQLSGRWLTPKYTEEANFDWDVAPFPKGEKGSIVPLDASGWAVSKDSKHKDEALRLVEFLASKNNSEKFIKSGLIVPARRDVEQEFLNSGKGSKTFWQIIKTSKPTPVSVNYNEILDKLSEKLEYKFN